MTKPVADGFFLPVYEGDVLLNCKMKNSSPVFDDKAAVLYIEKNEEAFLSRMRKLLRVMLRP